MLDTTKDIVLALINSGQICRHGDTMANIKDVKLAIKEINQQLLNAKHMQPNED